MHSAIEDRTHLQHQLAIESSLSNATVERFAKTSRLQIAEEALTAAFDQLE